MQDIYTGLVFDVDNALAYHFGMSENPKAPTSLRHRRERKGLSQTELAKRSGTSQPQISRLETDQREMTGPWAVRIASGLEDGTSPEDLVFGVLTVPIVGYVDAASEVHFQPPTRLARRPQGGTLDTVAIEVRGDSLGLGQDRWVLYYDDRRNPPTPFLIGNRCVVGLSTGQVLVKVLMRSTAEGRYDLWPFAAGLPIEDQQVEWAAVVIHTSHPDKAKVEQTEEEIAEPAKKGTGGKRQKFTRASPKGSPPAKK